ncbi:MAG: hypothetical protein R2774_04255 [Saprospiraceae bacterium]
MKFWIFSLTLLMFGCSNFENLTDIDQSESIKSVAIPLVNSKLSVTRLQELAEGNTSLKIDQDGHATIYYNGEVIRQSAASILPPLPGGLPYPIIDTISPVKLEFNNTYLIKKAVFDKTSIKFHAETSFAQNIDVTMRILELEKDGKKFETKFTIPFNGNLPSQYTTPNISLQDWVMTSESNTITFHYTATLPDGSKVKLDNCYMTFDLILFSYVDGYLGYHTFPVKGSTIDVNLFDQWKSGGFDFMDPKIVLSVENAFGLPVRSRVNSMELTSITGNNLSLQSSFINTGIDFAYPSFDEIGQVKITNFSFNNTNSNIREVFNEKTKTITYDIEALVNPDRDTTIKGFINRDSYFKVDVAVEVPLLGSIQQVVLSDTVDSDLPDFEDVISGQLKFITKNDFPADVIFYVDFLDANNAIILSLFDNQGFVLKAAPLKADDTTGPSDEVITFEELDVNEINALRSSKRIVLTAKLNTTESDVKKPLWILDRYGVDIKLGAILNVTL